MAQEKTEERGGSSFMKILAVLLGVAALIMCTAIGTLMISRSYFSTRLCGRIENTPRSSDLMFNKQTEWTPVETLEIPEKGVKVVRTYSTDRCYIMPLGESESGDIARPLELVPGKLTEDLIVQLAGSSAADFCEDLDTFLLKDPVEVMRRKRQAWKQGPSPGKWANPAPANPASAPTAQAAPAAESDLDFGRGGAPKEGEKGWRSSGLDFPYEQRVPRCMDLVLDCGKPGAIGEVQECFTWANGVIKMAQKCIEPNKFQIFMTKPPGRILKVAQKQWILCLQRRRKGLRC